MCAPAAASPPRLWWCGAKPIEPLPRVPLWAFWETENKKACFLVLAGKHAFLFYSCAGGKEGAG